MTVCDKYPDGLWEGCLQIEQVLLIIEQMIKMDQRFQTLVNIPSIGDFYVETKGIEQLDAMRKYFTILPSNISMNGIELRPRVTLKEIMNDE